MGNQTQVLQPKICKCFKNAQTLTKNPITLFFKVHTIPILFTEYSSQVQCFCYVEDYVATNLFDHLCDFSIFAIWICKTH